MLRKIGQPILRSWPRDPPPSLPRQVSLHGVVSGIGQCGYRVCDEGELHRVWGGNLRPGRERIRKENALIGRNKNKCRYLCFGYVTGTFIYANEMKNGSNQDGARVVGMALTTNVTNNAIIEFWLRLYITCDVALRSMIVLI